MAIHCPVEFSGHRQQACTLQKVMFKNNCNQLYYGSIVETIWFALYICIFLVDITGLEKQVVHKWRVRDCECEIICA